MSHSERQRAAVIRAATAEFLEFKMGWIKLLAEPETIYQCPHVHHTRLRKA